MPVFSPRIMGSLRRLTQHTRQQASRGTKPASSTCRTAAALLLRREDHPMPSTQELSVDELREKSERARGELAATVGELRDRVGETATELKTLVSPSHIKREIRNYVSEERESVMQSIQQR